MSSVTGPSLNRPIPRPAHRVQGYDGQALRAVLRSRSEMTQPSDSGIGRSRAARAILVIRIAVVLVVLAVLAAVWDPG